MDDDLIDMLANTVFELQDVDDPDIILLQRKLEQTQKAIDNLIRAMEAGIFSESTQERLETLEAEKTRLRDELLQAELKEDKLSIDQIRSYIYSFRKLNPHDQEHRQKLIDSFVNSVRVYDDKILMIFNYKDGTDTITLNDIESSNLDELQSTK